MQLLDRSFYPCELTGKLVWEGLLPTRHMKRHLASAPDGNAGMAAGSIASMSARICLSATHWGTSTPSGVDPTCHQQKKDAILSCYRRQFAGSR